MLVTFSWMEKQKPSIPKNKLTVELESNISRQFDIKAATTSLQSRYLNVLVPINDNLHESSI